MCSVADPETPPRPMRAAERIQRAESSRLSRLLVDKGKDRKDETGRTGTLSGLTVSAKRRVNRSRKVILSTAFFNALVEKGLVLVEVGGSDEGAENVEVTVD